MSKPKTITIDEVEYVRSDSVGHKAESMDGMEYKIIRAEDAGVFAGYIEKREGKEVTIRSARRLWYWSGASSLSQLANEGVKNPQDCKFPDEVDRILVTNAIEILDCTKKAKNSIASVIPWKQ